MTTEPTQPRQEPEASDKCPICEQSIPHNHPELSGKTLGLSLACELANIHSMHAVVAVIDRFLDGLLCQKNGYIDELQRRNMEQQAALEAAHEALRLCMKYDYSGDVPSRVTEIASQSLESPAMQQITERREKIRNALGLARRVGREQGMWADAQSAIEEALALLE